MSSESIRASRIARYSLAATAAAATGMADLTVHADVTSGSFSVSFGRVGGTNFFNGFTSSSSRTATASSLIMGDLHLSITASLSTSYADASFKLGVFNESYSQAAFVANTVTLGSNSSVSVAQQVAAGQVWNGNSASTTTYLGNAIFYSYYTNSTFASWINPDANGTKFLNFFLDGEEETIYGWIQLDWDINDANDWSVSVSNWAYTSDGPLAAGDTVGSQAVPGLGGLAALAIGAAGVRGRRQRMAG